jgi:hypothetical protein
MLVPRNSLVVIVALHVWIERREISAEVDKCVIFVAFLTRPDVNWSNNRYVSACTEHENRVVGAQRDLVFVGSSLKPSRIFMVLRKRTWTKLPVGGFLFPCCFTLHRIRTRFKLSIYIALTPCPCALFLEVLTPDLMNLHTWLSFCFCSDHRFCRDQIRSVYGGRSKELKTFQRVIRNLEKG